jgi:hypothetical protein
MRAVLPAAALNDTLHLGAAPQTPVDNVHQTTVTGQLSASVLGSGGSQWVTFVATAFVLAGLRRRRRRVDA